MNGERLGPWTPTPDELEEILGEMRPIILAFARRAQEAMHAVETDVAARRSPAHR